MHVLYLYYSTKFCKIIVNMFRPVKVMRLIGRSTVEEIILHRAEAKLELTNTVIEGGQFSLGTSKDSLIADNNMQVT